MGFPLIYFIGLPVLCIKFNGVDEILFNISIYVMKNKQNIICSYVHSILNRGKPKRKLK